MTVALGDRIDASCHLLVSMTWTGYVAGWFGYLALCSDLMPFGRYTQCVCWTVVFGDGIGVAYRLLVSIRWTNYVAGWLEELVPAAI